MADTFCISYDKSGVVYFFFLFYHFGKAKQKTVVNRTNIGSKHTDQITSSDTHSYMHVIQANPLSATCTQVIPCLFKLGYLPTLSLLSKEIHAILKSILVQFIPLSARLIYSTTFSFLIYWQYSLFNIWTSSWGGEFYPFSFSLSLSSDMVICQTKLFFLKLSRWQLFSPTYYFLHFHRMVYLQPFVIYFFR